MSLKRWRYGTTDIRRRKPIIDVSFRRLANILKATGISRKTKVSVLKSLVLTVL